MKWDEEGLHINGYIINKKIFPLLFIILGIILLVSGFLK